MFIKIGVLIAGLKPVLKPFLLAIIKGAIKYIVFAVVAFGLALVGLLPSSPFRIAHLIMVGQYMDAMSFMRYLPVFIPFYEMFMIFNTWIAAILVWYALKIPMRISRVIK